MRLLRATVRLCRRCVLLTLACVATYAGASRELAAQASPARDSAAQTPTPSADSLLKRIDALESRVDTVSSVATWAANMRSNGLVILAFIGGGLLLFLLFDLWGGRDVTFDSHWGGFGSGTGGFHLSRPLVVLTLLVLTVLTFLVAQAMAQADERREMERQRTAIIDSMTKETARIRAADTTRRTADSTARKS
jgi:hypothetical protein